MVLEFIGVTGVAVITRNLLGWFENAFQDKKISKYEWQQLGATTLRLGLMVSALHFGFNVGEVESASLGILLDMTLTGIKNKASA